MSYHVSSSNTFTSFTSFCILSFFTLFFFSACGDKKPAEAPDFSIDIARAQSDSLYTALKVELARYKQNNEDLYENLAKKESELEVMYGKIKRSISQANRMTSAKQQLQEKLLKLREELSSLEIFVEKQSKNLEELREDNLRLQREKRALQAAYEKEQADRLKLETERASLEEANAVKDAQLARAAVLQVRNFVVTGARLRRNGKKKATESASRADLFSICFDLIPNEFTATGYNRFFARITGPDGKVFSEALNFESAADQTPIDYTLSKHFEYSSEVKALCMEWFSTTDKLAKGTYTIALYNKGYKIETTSLRLK